MEGNVKYLLKGVQFFRKNFQQFDLPYVLLGRMGYHKGEINKNLFDNFKLALAITSLEALPEIIEKTINNAELSKKELGDEEFVFCENGKNEVNVYTILPIYFKKSKQKADFISQKLIQQGYEATLFYKSDFYSTINRANANLNDFPISIDVTDHMVPIGIHGLNEEQIFELGRISNSFFR